MSHREYGISQNEEPLQTLSEDKDSSSSKSIRKVTHRPQRANSRMVVLLGVSSTVTWGMGTATKLRLLVRQERTT